MLTNQQEGILVIINMLYFHWEINIFQFQWFNINHKRLKMLKLVDRLQHEYKGIEKKFIRFQNERQNKEMCAKLQQTACRRETEREREWTTERVEVNMRNDNKS